MVGKQIVGKPGNRATESLYPGRQGDKEITNLCLSSGLPGFVFLFSMFVLLFGLAACTPTPTGNVLGYLLAEQTGSLTPSQPQLADGGLTGVVTAEGLPLAGAAVIVAERTGRPHVAYTDAQGRYHISAIPPGQYVPAAVAPGYDEAVLTDAFHIPYLVTIQSGAMITAPTFTLLRHLPAPLPQPFPEAAHLRLTATAIVTAAFPAGSQAQLQAFQFDHAGITVDTLRLYLPLHLPPEQQLPLLFMVYPTQVDLWQSVSVAYAAQGYALVAISPMAVHQTDVRAHAADAWLAFELAHHGALSPQIDGRRAMALGGSFSSAILHRLLRDTHGEVAGWVTVGGISDAFQGTADFYAGQLEIPPQYRLLIPALGPPNLYPLEFLRYSPVYTAAQLPPTLIIHTNADHVIPIDQAYRLEAALRAASVAVDVFYYQDVSHYLQIDDQMTDQGRAMFYQILTFAKQRLKP